MRKTFNIADFALWDNFPLQFLATIAVLIMALIATDNKHKYTIIAQDKTYQVDNFRVYGGQLNFSEGDKSVIVKGNYIIEINQAK